MIHFDTLADAAVEITRDYSSLTHDGFLWWWWRPVERDWYDFVDFVNWFIEHKIMVVGFLYRGDFEHFYLNFFKIYKGHFYQNLVINQKLSDFFYA